MVSSHQTTTSASSTIPLSTQPVSHLQIRDFKPNIGRIFKSDSNNLITTAFLNSDCIVIAMPSIHDFKIQLFDLKQQKVVDEKKITAKDLIPKWVEYKDFNPESFSFTHFLCKLKLKPQLFVINGTIVFHMPTLQLFFIEPSSLSWELRSSCGHWMSTWGNDNSFVGISYWAEEGKYQLSLMQRGQKERPREVMSWSSVPSINNEDVRFCVYDSNSLTIVDDKNQYFLQQNESGISKQKKTRLKAYIAVASLNRGTYAAIVMRYEDHHSLRVYTTHASYCYVHIPKHNKLLFIPKSQTIVCYGDKNTDSAMTLVDLNTLLFENVPLASTVKQVFNHSNKLSILFDNGIMSECKIKNIFSEKVQQQSHISSLPNDLNELVQEYVGFDYKFDIISVNFPISLQAPSLDRFGTLLPSQPEQWNFKHDFYKEFNVRHYSNVVMLHVENQTHLLKLERNYNQMILLTSCSRFILFNTGRNLSPFIVFVEINPARQFKQEIEFPCNVTHVSVFSHDKFRVYLENQLLFDYQLEFEQELKNDVIIYELEFKEQELKKDAVSAAALVKRSWVTQYTAVKKPDVPNPRMGSKKNSKQH